MRLLRPLLHLLLATALAFAPLAFAHGQDAGAQPSQAQAGDGAGGCHEGYAGAPDAPAPAGDCCAAGDCEGLCVHAAAALAPAAMRLPGATPSSMLAAKPDSPHAPRGQAPPLRPPIG